MKLKRTTQSADLHSFKTSPSGLFKEPKTPRWKETTTSLLEFVAPHPAVPSISEVKAEKLAE
jgi:hypothetical protein